MKIIYNSRLAMWLTLVDNIDTKMLFGIIFTEEAKLSETNIRFYQTKVLQFKDYLMLGLFIDLFTAFLMFACNIVSWWMLLLLLIPVLLYYILYLAEYLWKRRIYGKDARKNISFEREAYYNEQDPCYNGVRVSFSNLKYLRKRRT